MINIVMYTYNDRAFGSLHYSLAKYLFTRDINAELLPWQLHYSNEEFQSLNQVTDLFFTNPDGFVPLRQRGIPANKIVILAHALLDLHQLLKSGGVDAFEECNTYAVTSQFLAVSGVRLGITRSPVLLPIGINTHTFAMPPAESLKTIGYAGVVYRADDMHRPGQDIKRGYLAAELARGARLDFKIADGHTGHFSMMPGFYKDVDCIVVSSLEEGAGLPVLEASAAGRMVLSTNVGHFPDIYNGEGHILPFDERSFLEEGLSVLHSYQNDANMFHARCKDIQNHALQHYDWSTHMLVWEKILREAYERTK